MAISLVRSYLQSLQQSILTGLQSHDEQPFLRDAWTSDYGSGTSCIIENGSLFERGGVNISHVKGDKFPPSGSEKSHLFAQSPYEAVGLSLVLHPRNPHCPTVHMNLRYFQVHHPDLATERPTWWFGGGLDMTPYYPQEEDVRHFHQQCFDAVEPFSLIGGRLYEKFKRQCDQYFYLPHRQEARGVGGLFFDDLNERHFDYSYGIIQSIGDSFLDAYLPIIERRKNTPYGQRERDFQAYRRGRYAEFNLACDRGTLFGLRSGGRTESILISLPPTATWRYNWQPEAGSPEAKLATFLTPQDWL